MVTITEPHPHRPRRLWGQQDGGEGVRGSSERTNKVEIEEERGRWK